MEMDIAILNGEKLEERVLWRFINENPIRIISSRISLSQ